MATVKHHGTGKRSSKKNPQGPTYYHAPHLAFFDPAEFDELVALLEERNQAYRRKSVNGVDPRANISRKRTRFPGQHARCWYCGRTYNWGGNGIIGHLTCSGSHKYLCWNAIHLDGALVVDRVRAAITDALYQLDGFDDQFRQIVDAAYHTSENGSTVDLQRIEAEEGQLDRDKVNLLASLKAFGPKPMILDEIDSIERQVQDLARRRYLVTKANNRPMRLPQSVADLHADLEAQFQPLNVESAEFGTLLRQIVPEFDVFLVRLIDGGHPMPRARIKLVFSGIVPDVARVPALDALLTRVLTIDLFDPPQRERIRTDSVRLEAEGLQQRQISQTIEERPKQAAVNKSLALHRHMLWLGLTSPYLVLREPPGDYPKMRRHRNCKYHFTPLDGFVAPEI